MTMNVHICNNDSVIYESKWARSEKHGNRIHKIFLHDSYPKIRKEVLLLQLSLGREVILTFDELMGHWISESDYIDLQPIVGNVVADKLILQLESIFNKWKFDDCYRSLVKDDWLEIVVPWYSSILQTYLPNSEEILGWLKESKGEHFIHGDFTLSNVFLRQDGSVVVLDYENATLGPFLWDETTLVYSFIEHRQYEFAKQLYQAFSCNKEMLRVISGIRLAQSLRKTQNIEQRKEAHEYIFQNY